MSASQEAMNNEVVVNAAAAPDGDEDGDDGGLGMDAPNAPLIPVDRYRDSPEDHHVIGYGFIEIDLPGDPEQIMPYTSFYGDGISYDDWWSGWEAIYSLYRYVDNLLDIEVFIHVAYVTDETVINYIEPILDNLSEELTDTERYTDIEAMAAQFIYKVKEFHADKFERFANPLDIIYKDNQEEVIDQGGRVLFKSTPSGMEEIQEWFAYFTGGRAIVSRGLQRGPMCVEVYVYSNDQRGYDAGIEILDSFRPMQQRETVVTQTLDDLINIGIAGLLLDDGRLYSLDDKPEALIWLEKNFGAAKDADYEPGCPVRWARLLIATNSGKEFTIFPALDDCKIFMFDDRYYSWGSGSNEEFFALFGATDYESLLELPHDDIVIRAN